MAGGREREGGIVGRVGLVVMRQTDRLGWADCTTAAPVGRSVVGGCSWPVNV